MIGLVTKLVSRVKRALGVPRTATTSQSPHLPPTPLPLAVAVAQAGELVQQRHQTRRATKVQTSLPTTTRNKKTTTEMVVKRSLLQTIRLTAVTLAHQVVGAAVAPVVQAVPVAPAGEVAMGVAVQGIVTFIGRLQ